MAFYIRTKRVVEQVTGWASAVQRPWLPVPTRQVCILTYHRVAPISFVDGRYDDWNVPPPLFARQLEALSQFAEVIPLSEVPRFLSTDELCPRPAVALTFDDGHASIVRYALPWLRRFGFPATFFIVTGVVGQSEPMPFDRWGLVHQNDAPPATWAPVTWPELETALGTGLVTVGGHSHTHFDPRGASNRWETEVPMCHEELARRFGSSRVWGYSYPYGSTALGFVPNAYVTAVEAAGFGLAVTTDLGLTGPAADLFRLPRVLVHSCDGPAVIRAKACGALAPFQWTQGLRRPQRRH